MTDPFVKRLPVPFTKTGMLPQTVDARIAWIRETLEASAATAPRSFIADIQTALDALDSVAVELHERDRVHP